MIKIYYSTVLKPLSAPKLACYLAQIPVTQQKKFSTYARWQDSHANLFGKLLLQYGLSRAGLANCSLEDVKCSTHGRPYLDDAIDFNISHSGQVVVCVLSDEYRVGIDIEEIKPIELNDFTGQWTPQELQSIMSSVNPYEAFYQLWTKKEALLKAWGIGLSIPLAHIHMAENYGILKGTQWFVQAIEVAKNYQVHLVTDKEVRQEISIEKVDFP